MTKNKAGTAFLAAVIFLFLIGFERPETVDYSDSNNWAYFETETADKQADVFFLCPTVYFGTEDSFSMPLEDAESRASFLGATNMEKGIYDANCRFFAPYYRQAGLNVYLLSPEEREVYLDAAYQDVRDAFDYYLSTCNEGRPIVLAGFSQGADQCIRLLKDRFSGQELLSQLVACYAVGWSITEQELAQYPGLKPASGESDTGVIVSFNSEAETVHDSLMIPAGTRTLAINPLNWKTDGTFADKALNNGACFTDYSGMILREIPQLTGAYLDAERGALKVPDVSPEEYPPVLSIFEKGIYHLYDYQFFYRNLQKNVSVRAAAFSAARPEG